MSQDPIKTKVIELLREWCDDPPVSVDEAVKVLSELVYPSKYDREVEEFNNWFNKESAKAFWGLDEQVAAKKAWLAARGHN
jgi:hypothetical protein